MSTTNGQLFVYVPHTYSSNGNFRFLQLRRVSTTANTKKYTRCLHRQTSFNTPTKKFQIGNVDKQMYNKKMPSRLGNCGCERVRADAWCFGGGGG